MLRKLLILPVIVIALSAAVSGIGAQESPPGTSLVIDNFAGYQAGKFPSKWRTWPFQRGKATEVYQVAQENGQKILRARDSNGLSPEIMRYFNWDIQKYPYLSWRWKAKTLPTGAQENDDNKNDSACGIYVIVGGYTGNAVKYVWSSQLPAGQIVTRREGKLKIKITDSGAAKLNTWRKNSVNVPADYKELFGSELKKNPSGIGVLTDSNATGTDAACDYADFIISKEPLK